MCWNPYPLSMPSILPEQDPRNAIYQSTILSGSNSIPLEEILSPFALNTRLNVPETNSLHSQNDTRQQTAPDNGAQDDTADPKAIEYTLTPDPNEIYEFMAYLGHLATGDTPAALDIENLGAPLAPVNLESPYMLSKFMTIKTPDEPLVHEARQAIRAGRIFEGQNMLSMQMKENGCQGQQMSLSPGSSIETLVTQSSTESCTEYESESQ